MPAVAAAKARELGGNPQEYITYYKQYVVESNFALRLVAETGGSGCGAAAAEEDRQAVAACHLHMEVRGAVQLAVQQAVQRAVRAGACRAGGAVLSWRGVAEKGSSSVLTLKPLTSDSDSRSGTLTLNPLTLNL